MEFSDLLKIAKNELLIVSYNFWRFGFGVFNGFDVMVNHTR